MRVRASFLIFALAATSSSACARPKRTEHVGTSAIADTPENKLLGEVDEAALDRTVNPCTDFYAYACGGWIQSTRIPDDIGVWSRGFSEARAHDDEVLRAILMQDTIHPPADQPQSAALGDFFASCLDDTAIDARGDAELTKLLDSIDTHDADAIAKSVAHLHLLGVSSLFVLEPEPDLHDARRMAAVIRQPLLPYPTDSIERALSSSLEDRSVFHDARIAPQIIDANALPRLVPSFRWKTYFAELGISPPSTLHVATPHYLAALDPILATAKPDDLRRTFTDELRHSIAQPSTRGADRWKACAHIADDLLGNALAVSFAEMEMNDRKADRARSEAELLRAAMLTEIDKLAWMDDGTREAARRKIETLSIAIGIPREKPDDRDDAKIGRASFLSDVVRLRTLATQRNLATIGQATNFDAWRFSGSTANAYFDPRKNEMVIAAGILVAPIFDERRTTTSVFDAIVGHELTHALGGRFDENGNMVNWWSDHTAEEYAKRVECVRRDLETISKNEKLDLHVEQILEESIADSGGLRVAYRAQDPHPKQFYGMRDQAFFTAYAQTWCSAYRPEALASFIVDNPHAPPRVRVNRAVADIPEFADAFFCKAGDAMTKKPADRCEVW